MIMGKDEKLSSKVTNQNFVVKALGYCCEDVDKFLDDLNLEIVQLERKVEQLEKDNYRLQADAIGDKQAIKDLNFKLNLSKAQDNTTASINYSNIDLLNRITNLENMVQEILNKITNL